jgi:hypothetical protein
MRIPIDTSETGFTLLETMVALAVFIIILAGAMSSINHLMVLAGTADRTMLVATENQRGSREMKNDLYCSTKYSQDGAPRAVDGELRFQTVTGFDYVEFVPKYSGYYVCYWLDTEKNLLVRRFRDLANEVLLEDAPAEYPGSKSQVICQYCTGVSFSVNEDAGMVTITLINSIGQNGTIKYAEYNKQFSVIPFN